MSKLPDTGFLRLVDVIGEEGITEEQAAANREFNRQAKADAIKNGRLDTSGNPIYTRRRTTARPARPGFIPVKKTCWWDGVKSGRFPKGVKVGKGRGTFWRVEDIRTLIKEAV